MSRAIPILLYHSVDDDPPGGFRRWTVGRRQFAEHLDAITALGCTASTVTGLCRALCAGTPLPPNPVVITIDDGLADCATAAWPELVARGIPATLYATAGHLGGSARWLAPLGAGGLPMLSAQALTELADDGLEIGAHSMTHPELDCVPRAAAHREILGSKRVLEDVLDRPVESFAYPHGFHDEAVKALVAGAGYTSATAVGDAVSHAGDDVYALTRMTITDGCGTERLVEILRGRRVRRSRPRERWRTTVWRQVRRRRNPQRAELHGCAGRRLSEER